MEEQPEQEGTESNEVKKFCRIDFEKSGEMDNS